MRFAQAAQMLVNLVSLSATLKVGAKAMCRAALPLLTQIELLTSAKKAWHQRRHLSVLLQSKKSLRGPSQPALHLQSKAFRLLVNMLMN
jgi:hypothetical protein